MMARCSRDVADDLNECLPIAITSHEIEKYPEFTKILQSLTHHLTPDGSSTIVKRDLRDVEQSLKLEKTKWLHHHILYGEIQDLLADHQLEEVKQQSSSFRSGDSNKFYKALQEVLTLAEVPDYLDMSPDPESKVTLLGLSEDDVQRINPYQKHMQSIQQKLIPEVESRLRKRCDELATNYELTMPKDTKDESSFVESSQLPTILETEQQSFKAGQRLLKREQIEKENAYWLYCKAVMDCCHLLEVLITKHRLGSQPDSDRVKTEWLAARCDGLCLKLKSFELQLLCDTYQAEHVKTLSKIRLHLDSAIAKTNEDIESTSRALEAYLSIGMGFEELAVEYSQLLEEIERRKWGLKELNKHKQTARDGL